MFALGSMRTRVAASAGILGTAYVANSASKQQLTHCRSFFSRAAPGLDPNDWKPLKLTSVKPISANTAIYRFAYDDQESTSGMTVASCLVTKAPIGSTKADGSRANVIRPYTPISRPNEKGYLEL